MPGSPRSDSNNIIQPRTRVLHPAALLLTCALLGLGLTLGGSIPDLALSAALLAAFALRAESRPIREELPLWGLASVVFLANLLIGGVPFPARLERGAAIALRLLALLYLVRWSARAWLGRAGRWLLTFRVPSRPRFLLLAMESVRHATALVPLAVRESGQQHDALRARGLAPGRGVGARARYIAAWLLPFLGTMLRLSESYLDALTVRGYRMGAPRGRGVAEAWGWPEVTVVAIGSAGALWLLRGI